MSLVDIVGLIGATLAGAGGLGLIGSVMVARKRGERTPAHRATLASAIGSLCITAFWLTPARSEVLRTGFMIAAAGLIWLGVAMKWRMANAMKSASAE